MALATGIHHITAVSGDAEAAIGFYAGLLGLRLVKCTVNYDDPTSHHLHFGDEEGSPGSILGAAVEPGLPPGRPGTGQAVATALAIIPEALGYWIDRLLHHDVRFEGPTGRFREEVLTLRDPDGLLLELVATPEARERPPGWTGGAVAGGEAIRGLHSATLWTEGFHGTAAILSSLGFREAAAEGSRFRFVAGDEGPGAIIDVRCAPDFRPGIAGRGTVRRVALRVPDDTALRRVLRTLLDRGLDATPPLDRGYYHSAYLREPGGTLLEISTDGPGYAVDEPPQALGQRLALPPWMEPCRHEIEETLPALQLPEALRLA